METKMFFPVEDIHFKDLYDWSDPSDKGQTTKVTVDTRAPSSGSRRQTRRQSSQTGSLVKINEQKVALFRYKERVYAVSEKCPHAGGPLHVGDIEVLPDKSICVKCPWHSWCFDLETGKVKRPKGRDLKATIFPTKVSEDGSIAIGFDSFSPTFFSDEINF